MSEGKGPLAVLPLVWKNTIQKQHPNMQLAVKLFRHNPNLKTKTSPCRGSAEPGHLLIKKSLCLEAVSRSASAAAQKGHQQKPVST